MHGVLHLEVLIPEDSNIQHRTKLEVLLELVGGRPYQHCMIDSQQDYHDLRVHYKCQLDTKWVLLFHLDSNNLVDSSCSLFYFLLLVPQCRNQHHMESICNSLYQVGNNDPVDTDDPHTGLQLGSNSLVRILYIHHSPTQECGCICLLDTDLRIESWFPLYRNDPQDTSV